MPAPPPPHPRAEAADIHPPRRPLVVALAALVAFGIGALLAVQSRINGELGLRLGDGYVAALISFGSGLVMLTIALAAAPTARAGLARLMVALRERRVPWWIVVGGASGGFYVLSQGLTVAPLGVALFTVALVAGQTLSGLAVDAHGLGSMLPKAITVTRLVGSVLAVVAVVGAVSSRLVGGTDLWLLVLPFVSGLLVGWQQAVTGQVREASASTHAAAWVNFAGGTAVLVVAVAVHAVIAGLPERFPTEPLLYAGGAVGVVGIAATAAVVRTTGVLVLGLGSLAGQLATSVLIEVAAPVPGSALEWTTLAGTLLALAAVALAAVPSRALRSRPARPRR